MASIFRRKKNGKYCGKWLIKYKDGNEWKIVAGYTDKAATQKKANLLELDSEYRQRGIEDQFAESKKVSLDEHCKAFQRHLELKDNCKDHVERTLARLKAILNGCAFKRIADLSKFDATDKVNAFLTAHAEAENLKAQTVGYYITALKAFCRWAAKNRRMPASPLALMDKPAPEDSTRERRVISGEQFQILIQAALNGPRTQRLTGEQRAWVYLVSAATGLRAGEVATLTPTNFQLDAEPPCVVARGSISKNGEPVDLPIPAELANQLRPWLAKYDEDQRLWPGRWYRKAAEMLRVDLKAAGIKYKTAAGYFDFHALRASYVTALVNSGADLKTVQTLARHSTITLTMGRYAKTDKDRQAEAVNRLNVPSIES